MKISWILRIILLAVFTVLAFGLAVMLLWNWLIPVLFNGPTINLWQASGLLALSKILSGGFGRRRWGGNHFARKRAWRKKFQEKWDHMTSEEKGKFRQHFSHYCRHCRSTEKVSSLQKV